MQWIKMTDRMPSPDHHDRVLIYTDGYDFNGEQVFDVQVDTLNECYYADPEDQPEVCKRATHWAPHPRDDGALRIKPIGIVCGIGFMHALDRYLPAGYYTHISSAREATSARSCGQQIIHVLGSERPNIEILQGERTADGTAGAARAAAHIYRVAAGLG